MTDKPNDTGRKLVNYRCPICDKVEECWDILTDCKPCTKCNVPMNCERWKFNSHRVRINDKADK